MGQFALDHIYIKFISVTFSWWDGFNKVSNVENEYTPRHLCLVLRVKVCQGSLSIFKGRWSSLNQSINYGIKKFHLIFPSYSPHLHFSGQLAEYVAVKLNPITIIWTRIKFYSYGYTTFTNINLFNKENTTSGRWYYLPNNLITSWFK